MKKTVTTFLSITLLSLLISCKGDKGEVGPSGQNGRDEDSWTYKDGYVKGQFSGTFKDGTTLNFNYDMEGNELPFSNSYLILSDESTIISVNKLYSGEGEPLMAGEFYLNIKVPDLNTLDSPELQNFMIFFRKDLGNGKYFNETFDDGAFNTTVSIENLNYNSVTKVLTGSYSLDVGESTYRGNYNINGTFSTILNQTVARVGQSIE